MQNFYLIPHDFKSFEISQDLSTEILDLNLAVIHFQLDRTLVIYGLNNVFSLMGICVGRDN